MKIIKVSNDMDLASTMQNLYAQFGELQGITIECQNDLIAIGVENKAAEAEIFLQGAQVSRYQRRGADPILWLSRANEYKQGQPLRGGIPICWPWFGDIKKNPQSIQAQFTRDKLEQLSAHGFVRQRDWQVESITMPADDKTVIELSYQIYAEQEAQWPFATELLYRIEVGENLDAALTIRNKDSMPFTFSCALHSYYAVEHINQVRIEGFDQSPYLDAMDNWSCNIQKGDILIDEEVDRIYQTAPDAITLSDAERKISIRNKNSNSTVVWNPWQEKAKRLTQFADDDYQTMLCIETANIADDVIYLESDESHTLHLSVQP